MEEKLGELLKSGKDWERKATSVAGVFVLRMPPFRGSPARLAVELNPVDEYGRPTKKRGIILRSSEDLNGYRKLLNDEKLAPLVKAVESLVKPEKKEAPPKPDVIQL